MQHRRAPGRGIWWQSLFALMVFGALAQPPQKEAALASPRPRSDASLSSAPPNLGSTGVLASLPLKPIAPGVFELGLVTLNRPQRMVAFPATLNLDGGPVEYLAVASFGKTHESVFRTEAAPYDIHLAMLLVGANAGSSNTLPVRPGVASNASRDGAAGPEPLADPSKELLPGDKIDIEVIWKSGGKEIRRPAGEFIFNTRSKSTPTNAAWIYNGSRVSNGQFFAQLGGSIASLVTDPDALANYSGPGHDDDDVWTVHTNSLPPLRTPVLIAIKLVER